MPAQHNPFGRAHQAFDRLDSAIRVQGVLIPGRGADQDAVVRGEADDRGHDLLAIDGQNLDLVANDGRDLRVGRTQVDTEDNVVGHGPCLMRAVRPPLLGSHGGLPLPVRLSFVICRDLDFGKA